MDNSLSDGSSGAAAARKASPRANSVPLLSVKPEDLTTPPVIIAVDEEAPKHKETDHVVQEDGMGEEADIQEEDEEDSLREDSPKPVNGRTGTSVEIDLNKSVKIPIEPDTERTPSKRLPDMSPSKAVGRAATISTSTSTDDDGADSPARTIIPSITAYQNEKTPPAAFVAPPAKSLTTTKDKTEEQDKLLTKLGPVPQIVKTKPSIKKKNNKTHFLSRFFSRGAVEEGDGQYAASCGGGSGGSEEGGEGRLLQDGRIMVEGAEEPEGESSLSILMQVMLPFLVAGLGMVGAGLVLDMVQHWDVFVVISELFIMVPALLGLKGNLEMTLASRLSTHANMGHLDKTEDCISMIVGNLALIQCQAIVVGFLASVAAVVMGWIPQGDFNMLHTLLLCAAALVTASFASFILGVIMVAVILLSRKCRINPDNVATPIAASLGDLTTLGLLAWIASLLYEARGSDMWLAPLIICGYVLSLPLWVWLASRNRHTKEVLYSGWTPVISAMMISSMGGVILDYTVTSYKGIAVYQPVINGVGGNLVAVQASRISTALHLASPLGRLPRYADKLCHNPGTVFCTNTGHARTSRMLLLLVIPGHLVFAYTISYLKAGHTSLTPIFLIVYLCAAVLQVIILLYMSVVMVHWMWSVCIDPDNSAIPYLTACGDLLGTGLLAIAFHLLYLVGDRDSDIGD